MKVITFEDIKNMNIAPLDCYNWVCQMIKDKKTTILPAKTSLSTRDAMFMNTMPCILNDNWGGVKVVNRYPERKPSLDSKLLLINNDTGEFLALMDANWITAMRTGAVATHSIMNFAKKDFSTIGMLGLGNACRATMLILANVVTDRTLKIKLLRYKDQAEDFINRFKDYKNVEFTIVDTNEEVVRGSDVVVSCVTHFADDMCSDDCFDEGVLVVPVHTRGFTNCDLFFDKVYADDYGHVHHFKNFEKFKYFAEVCDVVNGNAVGRENDKERILAYNIGLSIHDVNFAAHIYEMVKDCPDIIDVDMLEPEDKFWI